LIRDTEIGISSLRLRFSPNWSTPNIEVRQHNGFSITLALSFSGAADFHTMVIDA
jgi:hypothetical protein